MKPGDLVRSVHPKAAHRQAPYHSRYERKLQDVGIDLCLPGDDLYLVVDNICYEMILYISQGAHSELLGRRWLKCMGPDGTVGIYDANMMEPVDETR
jgi:hypothetical protein